MSRTAAPPLDVTIADLGRQGDGVATLSDGRRLFVPGALPGEQVRVRPHPGTGPDTRATLETIHVPSPHRSPPPCPHFGRCGGCTLQHLTPTALSAWKRQTVVTALARRGLDPESLDTLVEPVQAIPPGTRRRCALSWHRTRGGITLGFHAQGTHTLEDITTCALLEPALTALLPALRAVLSACDALGPRGRVWLTATDSGVDAALAPDRAEAPGLTTRETLAAFAHSSELARLTLVSDTGMVEPVAVRHPPTTTIAGIPVAVPPLSFLQPSQAGGQAIAEAVLARLPADNAESTDAPVLDLFAGLGTLSLPLVTAGAGRPVHAVDSAGDALAALAASRPPRGHLTTETRDLMRDPVRGRALSRAAAVVFDPPRAGARAQAAALAEEGPPVVVAVSCMPATFARDARLLIDGGYRPGPITPIDQFPWAAHVEVVARFTRRPT